MRRFLLVTLVAILAIFTVNGSFTVRSAMWGPGALICLDPGHGGKDPGAVGNGILEKNVNLDIGIRARNILRGMGYSVLMTRNTDVYVSLEERCGIANSSGAEVFVSIHNNSSSAGGEGTETFCYYSSPEGRLLAEAVHRQVVRRIGLKNRGVKEAGFYVLKHTDMPAALLEGAFVSNEKEAKLLATPEFRQKIAEGVAQGIIEYLADPGMFDEYILILNPDSKRNALISVRYLTGGLRAREDTFEILAGERHTIYVDRRVRNADVSAVLRSMNGVPVVCERSMYFNFANGSGGHCSKGANSASTKWYLAEGSTGWGFSTFILVVNPSDKVNRTKVSLLRSDGLKKTFAYDIAPFSRFTLDVSRLESFWNADFSAAVNSKYPVVVERAMYFRGYNKISGGHVSTAVPKPNTRWYFAEGYTGEGFDTFVLIGNPNADAAKVRMVNLLPDGTETSSYVSIPPQSRRTIHLNSVHGLESTEVSTILHCSLPVVAERSMYFDYLGIKEGSNCFGHPFPSTSWYFAEGYTGKGFDTYILLVNPNDREAPVILKFFLPGGRVVQKGIVLPARSRKTIRLSEVGEISGSEVSVAVLSKRKILAERSMYFSKGTKSGGHVEAGSTAPAIEWYFSEGCTR